MNVELYFDRINYQNINSMSGEKNINWTVLAPCRSREREAQTRVKVFTNLVNMKRTQIKRVRNSSRQLRYFSRIVSPAAFTWLKLRPQHNVSSFPWRRALSCLYPCPLRLPFKWTSRKQHSTFMKPLGRPSKYAVNSVQGLPNGARRRWPREPLLHAAPEYCCVDAVLYLHCLLLSICQDTSGSEWWFVHDGTLQSLNVKCLHMEYKVLYYNRIGGTWRIRDTCMYNVVFLLNKWRRCGATLHCPLVLTTKNVLMFYTLLLSCRLRNCLKKKMYCWHQNPLFSFLEMRSYQQTHWASDPIKSRDVFLLV